MSYKQMIQQDRRKKFIFKKLVIQVLLVAFFLLLGLALNIYMRGSGNKEQRITRHVERVLREKEMDMERILALFNPGQDSTVDFSTISSQIPGHLFDQKGFLVNIYLGDSLVYWSGSEVVHERVELYPDSTGFELFSNGWFRILKKETGPYLVTGMILVRNQYPYQNEYLVNGFMEDFSVPDEVQLMTGEGEYTVHATDGTPLFSLVFPGDIPVDKNLSLVLFVIFLAALYFLMRFMLEAYDKLDFMRRKKWLFLAAFLTDLFIIRFLILYFRIPGYLYDSALFGPSYFATSYMNSSLGDLVINAFMLLFFAYVFHERCCRPDAAPGKVWKHLLTVAAPASVILGLTALRQLIRALVIDSNLVMSLENVFEINVYSILGFITLSSLILAFFLLATPLLVLSFRASGSLRTYSFHGLAMTALLILLNVSGLSSWIDWTTIGFIAVFYFSAGYFLLRKDNYRSFTAGIYFIILFAVFTTIFMNRFHDQKEKDHRRLLAVELSSRRDPLLEYEFRKAQGEIYRDSLLLETLYSGGTDQVSSYLVETYFSPFRNKYKLQVTVCNDQDILSIQPEGYLTNCFDYFRERVSMAEGDTISDKLFFLDYQSDNYSYLAYFEFPSRPDTTDGHLRIFLEMYYRFVKETGLGYPDLLIDKEVSFTSDLSNYSYARYYQGSLNYKYGDFSYNLQLSSPPDSGCMSCFYEDKAYNHYMLASGDDNILVISRKNSSTLDVAAPFSFLFIFYGLFLLVFLLIVNAATGFRQIDFTFRNQLQTAIIFLIVLSFVALGLITRSYIIRLNNNKNRDNLSEKAFSVLVEMEHKLGAQEALSMEMGPYISELLIKFSDVFISDINIYSTGGSLLASSRPEVFDEGLISRKMDPLAYNKLAFENNLLFIQEERIGQQEYLSAYLPFRNINDRVIAYLNLPYFAKQAELRNEIADFLSAFVNMYVLLIVLAILLTILVSRYITKPLQLIREKMGRIGYGRTNEKIEWDREDEIGSLVAEYNRMLDELARSAELLARSERESAWREMAMQVAHEIKNPLTPMKLSVQHLKRAWDDKSPEFEDRLNRFSATIIEQIESLSEIASEFSDFAKMPAGKVERTELTTVIRNSIGLFREEESITFRTHFDKEEYYILADQKQLLRVFNNLIKNSVQAIGKKPGGLVEISVKMHDGELEIEVSDNGSGIPEDQADKIFSPAFTTKSSGMGLGLTMVKSILGSMGARISFSSRVGEGARFYIHIPDRH